MNDDSQKPASQPPDGSPSVSRTAPRPNGTKPLDGKFVPPTGDEKPTSPPADAPPAPAPNGEAKPAPEEAKPSSESTAGAPVPPPVETSSAPSAQRPPRPIDPAEAHVLVVEDNVPNFVLIARLLAYMGVPRCEWKTSGWQVVEFADTLPRIDLILMDIRLPYEDGFQALEKVRSSDRLKETLVVAVTAEASVEQMKRAQECGFDGFLGKPLDPDRFPDQIRRVLKGEPVWEIH